MLSFYFAFYYSDRDYYDENRILCMAQYLFDVQQKNRLEQKGLLKRFSINCYGKQETLEDMRNTKAEKYKELKNKRNSLEYESWFLRYIPFEVKMEKEETKEMKNTNKKLKKEKRKLKNVDAKLKTTKKQLKNTRKRLTRKMKKRKSKRRVFDILNIL
jgi:hypothetical protein